MYTGGRDGAAVLPRERQPAAVEPAPGGDAERAARQAVGRVLRGRLGRRRRAPAAGGRPRRARRAGVRPARRRRRPAHLQLPPADAPGRDVTRSRGRHRQGQPSRSDPRRVVVAQVRPTASAKFAL